MKTKIIEYCLEKPFVTEHFPFDDRTWVAKVHGKMFALLDILDEEIKINLKYDSETIEDLRSEFDCVQPGYHMSKKHWNTVHYDPSEINFKQLTEWIDISYNLVFNSLPKKLKELTP